MIDSHCHLNFPDIKNKFDKIIYNSQLNHITSILSINTEPNEFDDHYNLIKDFKSIFLSYGLHPEHVSKTNLITSNTIINNCNNERVIGIGETGLDFYRTDEYKKEQYKVFENHIEASYKKNLPLIIHQRNSENEIIDLINNYHKIQPLNIVFHCFTGTSKLRNFCLDNNFYISLSGIVTFKNADNLRKVIKHVPLSSILIETDSPFLAPIPHRGKTNEPSFVHHVGYFLSNFFDIPFTNFVKITDDNFYKLFSKAIRYNKISK